MSSSQNVKSVLKLEAKSAKTLRISFQSNPLTIGILWTMITHSIYLMYSHQDQQLSTSAAHLYHLGSVCVCLCVCEREKNLQIGRYESGICIYKNLASLLWPRVENHWHGDKNMLINLNDNSVIACHPAHFYDCIFPGYPFSGWRLFLIYIIQISWE